VSYSAWSSGANDYLHVSSWGSVVLHSACTGDGHWVLLSDSSGTPVRREAIVSHAPMLPHGITEEDDKAVCFHVVTPFLSFWMMELQFQTDPVS
jgi:hypothetical protein